MCHILAYCILRTDPACAKFCYKLSRVILKLVSGHYCILPCVLRACYILMILAGSVMVYNMIFMCYPFNCDVVSILFNWMQLAMFMIVSWELSSLNLFIHLKLCCLVRLLCDLRMLNLVVSRGGICCHHTRHMLSSYLRFSAFLRTCSPSHLRSPSHPAERLA